MTRFFHRLADFVVGHRWFVFLLLIGITTLATIGHVQPRLILDLFEDDVVEVPGVAAGSEVGTTAPPNVDPVSISRADVVIVARSKQFFTPDGAKAMRRVVEKLDELDQTRYILWMDRVPMLNIFGLPEPILPNENASQQRFDAAKKKALAHPLVKGQLLSEDCETMLLMVTADRFHMLSDYEATDLLRETAEAAADEFPDTDIQFQVTGDMPITIAAISSNESNRVKYQTIGYGVIGLMAIILFRGIRAVVIVALAPILGVYWTIGFVGFLEYGQNQLLTVILPILVSLVGLTDGVHLMVQIRKLRAEGLDEREAARQGLRLVGLACFLTSLTTAIGFASLMLANSEWVQEFGLACVIGVLLCFMSVILAIPLACSTWLGRNVHVGQEHSLIDKNLSKVSIVIDAVLKRPAFMGVLAILVTAGLFAISLTLKPDQRQMMGLPQDAEATQGYMHMDKSMKGLEFSSVNVTWSGNVADDSPELLEVLTEVDDFLRSEELIGHPLSIRNLIDAQPGSGPPVERMSMLELLPPPLKRAFYTPERREANISFRVQDLGIARYGSVFERTEAKLAEVMADHPEYNLELAGRAVWRWKNLYQVVVDLALSLGTASIIIFIVLAIVYRSVRLGLISIIPNMFPLVVTGTYLALAGYNLELVMVVNFTVCLGIAVDDTIHFLTRYQEETALTPDRDLAIRNAFTGVGTALIMTTTVLVAGFSTVIASDSREQQIFAVMGVLTIGSALLGDLIFLPPLLSRFGAKAGSDAIAPDEAGPTATT